MSLLFYYVVGLLYFNAQHLWSCSVTTDFADPSIVDVWLTGSENLLTVKIDSGNAQNCREFDTNSQSLGFMDISCDTATYLWAPVGSGTPSTDLAFTVAAGISNTTTNTSSDTYWVDFLQLNDGPLELVLSSVGTPIHPTFHAWFYAAQLQVLYILSIDMSSYNATVETVAEYFSTFAAPITTNDLAVTFVAFNADQPLNETKDQYVVATRKWTELYSAAQNLPSNGKTSWDVTFDQTELVVFEPLNIFQMDAIINSCESNSWFSYEVLASWYDQIASSGSAFTYQLLYVGDGFTGLDDRNNRVYGYSYKSISWYDATTAFKETQFEAVDLTNWWMLIWIILGVVLGLVCICLCVCYCLRRQRKNQDRRAHFTASV